MLNHVKESFIPILGILVAIFILLYFVEGQTNKLADQAQIIHIDKQDEYFVENSEPIEREKISLDDPRLKDIETLVNNKEYDKAERSYIDLLAKKPSATLHYLLGALYLEKKEYKKALISLNSSIKYSKKYYRAYFSRAMVYLSTGKKDLAKEDLLKVITLLPTHAPAFYYLGKLGVEKNEFDDAINYLKQAITLSSGVKKARAYYWLAEAYVESDNKENIVKAQKAYNSSIRLHPQTIRARIGLIELMPVTKQNYAEKIKTFEKLLLLDPTRLSTHYAYAKMHLKHSNIKAAQEHLAKILQKQPYNLGALYLSAQILFEQKEYEKAMDAFDAIIKTNPEYQRAHFLYAKAAFFTQQYDIAIEHFKQTLKNRSKSSRTYYWLGRCYVNTSETKKAINAFNKAIRYDAQAWEAYYALAHLYEQMKQFPKAMDLYTKLTKENPSFYRAWYRKALLLKKEKAYDNAIKMVLQALAQKPTHVNSSLMLGELYLKTKKFNQAQQTYEAIIKRLPLMPEASYGLAKVYYKKSEYEKAKSTLARVLELNPAMWEAHYLLAKVFRAQQRNKEATELFRAVLDMNPSSVNVRLSYIKVLKKRKQYALALKECNNLLRLSPNHPTALKLRKAIKAKLIK